MSINNTIVVNQTAHGASIGLLFEVTELQSVGIALGLGLVAMVGIIVRCLFLYYIKYHAPKQRPLNKLIAYDQVSIDILNVSVREAIFHRVYSPAQYSQVLW